MILLISFELQPENAVTVNELPFFLVHDLKSVLVIGHLGVTKEKLPLECSAERLGERASEEVVKG